MMSICTGRLLGLVCAAVPPWPAVSRWRLPRREGRRMTTRKPPGMPFETSVDQQITQAQARGEFDGLAGDGKPLPAWSDDEDVYEWVVAKARQENLDLLGMLPPGSRAAEGAGRPCPAGRGAAVGGCRSRVGRGLQRAGAGVLAAAAGEPVVAGSGAGRRRGTRGHLVRDAPRSGPEPGPTAPGPAPASVVAPPVGMIGRSGTIHQAGAAERPRRRSMRVIPP